MCRKRHYQCNHEKFEILEKELSVFKLFTIEDDKHIKFKIIFATKIPEDIAALEKTKFNYQDNHYEMINIERNNALRTWFRFMKDARHYDESRKKQENTKKFGVNKKAFR